MDVVDENTDQASVPTESSDKSSSNFLCLPLELRQHVYSYSLPHTYLGQELPLDPRSKRHLHQQCTPYCWRPGNVSLLHTNKQINYEASKVLYANFTCSLYINHDCVEFLKKHDGDGRKTLAFPEAFGKSVYRIRRLFVVVNMRETKRWADISLGNSEWGDAAEGQVELLCVFLKRLEIIQNLELFVIGRGEWLGLDSEGPAGALSRLLKPFESLKNVCSMKTLGQNLQAVQEEVQRKVNGSWWTNSLLRLPAEVREKILEYLIPFHTVTRFAGQGPVRFIESYPPVRQDRGYAAIMRTCRTLYGESVRLLYGSNVFEIYLPDLIASSSETSTPTAPCMSIAEKHAHTIGTHNLLQIRHWLLLRANESEGRTTVHLERYMPEASIQGLADGRCQRKVKLLMQNEKAGAVLRTCLNRDSSGTHGRSKEYELRLVDEEWRSIHHQPSESTSRVWRCLRKRDKMKSQCAES